jgi:hypothetical protein
MKKKKKVFIKIETGLHYVLQETNSNQHKMTKINMEVGSDVGGGVDYMPTASWAPVRLPGLSPRGDGDKFCLLCNFNPLSPPSEWTKHENKFFYLLNVRYHCENVIF